MKLDKGFYFGIGAFETIYVDQKQPVLLDKHLKRINHSLAYLKISQTLTEVEITEFISQQTSVSFVLKIAISEENKIFSIRDNPYTADMYQQGFKLKISEVKRNETSPLTYHKTLNYAENILENELAKSEGFNEVVFMNTKNQISECSTSNIFFVRDKKIITPRLENGVLPGTLREYLLENYDIEEIDISIDDLASMDECFVTNAVLGIMPVVSLDNLIFKERTICDFLLKDYLNMTKNNLK
ncbi:aminotransferase class IV [Vagococcus hydrophili]|uniref:Aminotransferase class IV n=1 Tax=Vagococcus hydrophili TaxID=2714947 RepID=A0A6G8AUK1_9ENTE|nr:aminotransferase class IV [Vagococcus hydrophili]QIL48667.1 aminotransferase class IV [Vagococcus hydrophili]